MKNSITLGLMAAAMLSLGSCGSDSKKEAEEKTENPADALQALADKAKDMGSREAVDPVDFRKLKDLLPEKAAGLKRTEATGEKSGAMGFTVSTAEAKYSGAKSDETIEIGIVDTGGIAGVTTMALAAWSMAEIDKETAAGYEKTSTISGHKAFEKYDNDSKSGELNVLVADRFIVNVKGNNVTMEQLKDVLDDLELATLSEIK